MVSQPDAKNPLIFAVHVFNRSIKEGVATSQAFVFDTRAGIMDGEGEINLGTGQINFLLVPKPEHPDLSLTTKLRVSGTIMDPKVSPDKLSLPHCCINNMAKDS